MSKKEIERKEAQERVEAARKKILEDRRGLVESSPKISKQLLEGVEYTEEIVVKLKDGSYGVLDISCLSEGELLEAFTVLGLDKLDGLGNAEDESKFSVDDYKFFWKLISLATDLDVKLISKTFAMGESSMVGQRILEISGASGDNVEKFPEK
jgi:hypothetical protein